MIKSTSNLSRRSFLFGFFSICLANKYFLTRVNFDVSKNLSPNTKSKSMFEWILSDEDFQ